MHEIRNNINLPSKNAMNEPSSLVRRGADCFFYAAQCIFLLTAVLKLYSVLAGGLIFQALDPVIGVPIGSLLVLAALVEIAAAIGLGLMDSLFLKSATLCWVTALFGAYRLMLLRSDRACLCLGTIGDSLGISEKTISFVTGATLIILLAGSVMLLWLSIRANRGGNHVKTVPAPDL